MRKTFLTIILTLALLLTACSTTMGRTGNSDNLLSADPAEVDNSKLPITPIDEIHVTGNAPAVNIEDYHLSVTGAVDNPLSLTYEEVTSFPETTQVVLLICPLTFFDNAQWTGVPVSTLLDQAGIKSEATKVTIKSIDGYKKTFDLDQMLKDGTFMAYKVDGQQLPPEHGYPLRLVITGVYGGDWVKWVTSIEVS